MPNFIQYLRLMASRGDVVEVELGFNDGDNFLLEDGTDFLLEDNTNLQLEAPT